MEAAEEKKKEQSAIPAAILSLTNALETKFGAAIANTMRERPSKNHRRRARRAADKKEEAVVRCREHTDLQQKFQGCGYANKLINEEIRDATLDGRIPSAVVNSGATTTCMNIGKEQMQESECGEFKWKGLPFEKIGEQSNKFFAMALGHVAPGAEVVDVALPLRKEAREGHTIEGLKNNLFSINKLVQADYIPIFNKDTFDIYDAKNTVVTVSRRAVCRGYYDKRAQLWRLPLVNKGGKEEWRTATTKANPADILFNSPAPPTAHILNAYEIRAQPALIRYYHAAAGFPTKLTWLKAISNGHFLRGGA